MLKSSPFQPSLSLLVPVRRVVPLGARGEGRRRGGRRGGRCSRPPRRASAGTPNSPTNRGTPHSSALAASSAKPRSIGGSPAVPAVPDDRRGLVVVGGVGEVVDRGARQSGSACRCRSWRGRRGRGWPTGGGRGSPRRRRGRAGRVPSPRRPRARSAGRSRSRRGPSANAPAIRSSMAR